MNSVLPATNSIPKPRTTSWGNCWCLRRSLSARGCNIEDGRIELPDQLGVEPSPNKQICRLHRHPREAARRLQKPEDPPQLPKNVPLYCSNNTILEAFCCHVTHAPKRAFLELFSVQIVRLLLLGALVTDLELNIPTTQMLIFTEHPCVLLWHSSLFQNNSLIS